MWIKIWMGIFILFLFMGITLTVYALPTPNNVLSVNWDEPVKKDGSNYSDQELSGYYLYWRAAPDSYVDLKRYEVNGRTTTTVPISVIPTVPDGDYFISLTAFKTATPINQESDFAKEVGVKVNAGKFILFLLPNPPTNLRLQ